MTGQLTPNQVAQLLIDAARELDALTTALNDADMDATEKRHAADLAEDRAFLTAEGAVEQRKRAAQEKCEKLLLDAEVAEAVVRQLRRRVDAIQTRIEVGRSYSSIVKAEMALSGVS